MSNKESELSAMLRKNQNAYERSMRDLDELKNAKDEKALLHIIAKQLIRLNYVVDCISNKL